MQESQIEYELQVEEQSNNIPFLIPAFRNAIFHSAGMLTRSNLNRVNQKDKIQTHTPQSLTIQRE